MSHSHDPKDHPHHHHSQHGHGNDHGHDHEPSLEMTFHEKMEKLLTHWIHHNQDHVQNYRKWADKAMEEGLMEIGGLIQEAAVNSQQVEVTLQNALERLKEKGRK